MVRRSVYWGVFLVALSTLAWEVLLTRIFSATIYYHFVFISISLAMLGFGCSGVVVFLFPRFFSKERCSAQLTLSAALFSLTMLGAISAYLQIDSAFIPSPGTFAVLCAICALIFLPYFFSGLSITLALTHYSTRVNVLYCYDLIGAGLGCVFVMGMLFFYDGISLVIAAAALAMCAALLFSRSLGGTPLKRLVPAAVVLLAAAFAFNVYGVRFLRVQYVAGHPESDIIFEKWNPINRVTVRPAAPEIFDGANVLQINYDATALSFMHFFDGDLKQLEYLQRLPWSFYYRIRKDAEVMIIGVGGGHDVLTAYINGHRDITGVEINPTIVRLGRETYRHFNGDLFNRPGIRLVCNDGRNFIRHTDRQFDIIHLSNVDSFVASSSGSFTFVENSLYTVEAFKDYYRRLKDDGVLWMGRWNTIEGYFLETFRVLTGAVAALGELGVAEPEKHLVILEAQTPVPWRPSVVLLKKSPFGSEELRAIDRLRDEMGLVWLHHPERRMANVLDEYLFASDRQAILDRYPFRVDPNRDDCPFFYNFLKPVHYLWNPHTAAVPFTYPVFMFKSLLIIVTLMVVLTMFLPLLVSGSVRRQIGQVDRPWGYLLYFACLGLGFMFIEIPLIQKFILFLGQPLYAIGLILSTLLIASGTGSLLAGRFPEEAALRRLCGVILVLCAGLAAYIGGLPRLFELVLGMPLAVRCAVAVILLLPLGMLMGMAFPLGIRILAQETRQMIPWVWGINGACSVMGSALAWGVSLNFGYDATLWGAAAIYAGALLCMVFKLNASRTRGKAVEGYGG